MATLEEECVVIAGETLGLITIAGVLHSLRKKKVKRSIWVKPWI